MSTPAPPAPEPGVTITLTTIYNLLLSTRDSVEDVKRASAARDATVAQLVADVAALKDSHQKNAADIAAVVQSVAKVWTSRWGAPATAIGTGLAGLVAGLYGALHGG